MFNIPWILIVILFFIKKNKYPKIFSNLYHNLKIKIRKKKLIIINKCKLKNVT